MDKIRDESDEEELRADPKLTRWENVSSWQSSKVKARRRDASSMEAPRERDKSMEG